VALTFRASGGPAPYRARPSSGEWRGAHFFAHETRGRGLGSQLRQHLCEPPLNRHMRVGSPWSGPRSAEKEGSPSRRHVGEVPVCAGHAEGSWQRGSSAWDDGIEGCSLRGEKTKKNALRCRLIFPGEGTRAFVGRRNPRSFFAEVSEQHLRSKQRKSEWWSPFGPVGRTRGSQSTGRATSRGRCASEACRPVRSRLGCRSRS